MHFKTGPWYDLAHNPFAIFDDDLLFLTRQHQDEVATSPDQPVINNNHDPFLIVRQLNEKQKLQTQAVENSQTVGIKPKNSRSVTSRNHIPNSTNRRLKIQTKTSSTNTPKKPRRRKCENLVGYTIAAIKRIQQSHLFLVIDADPEYILKIQKCIKDLRKAIRKLKSSNGSLRDARIIINSNDQNLIEEIQNKYQNQRSKIEQMFWNILLFHDYEIVDQAKHVIRDALVRGMDSKWIEDFAYSVDFRQQYGEKTVEDKKREFHMYLSYFKYCLSRDGIAATLKRKDFEEFKTNRFH